MEIHQEGATTISTFSFLLFDASFLSTTEAFDLWFFGPKIGRIVLHLRKLTWNPQIGSWKMSFLLERHILRRYVSFRVCVFRFQPNFLVQNFESCFKILGSEMRRALHAQPLPFRWKVRRCRNVLRQQIKTPFTMRLFILCSCPYFNKNFEEQGGAQWLGKMPKWGRTAFSSTDRNQTLIHLGRVLKEVITQLQVQVSSFTFFFFSFLRQSLARSACQDLRPKHPKHGCVLHPRLQQFKKKSILNDAYPIPSSAAEAMYVDSQVTS